GIALDPRLVHAVPAYPHERRIQCGEDGAGARAYRAPPDPLRLTARLVLRADADPARPGGRDRIHHADLDRDPRRELSRRTHDGLEDRSNGFNPGRRVVRR